MSSGSFFSFLILWRDAADALQVEGFGTEQEAMTRATQVTNERRVFVLVAAVRGQSYPRAITSPNNSAMLP